MIESTLSEGRILLQASEGSRVTGHAGGLEWTVTEAAPAWRLTDWQAPIGLTITYRAGLETSTVTFTSSNRDDLAGLDGRPVVPIVRAAGRDREISRGLSTYYPGRAALPYTRRGHPNRRSEALEFGAPGSATETLEALLEEPRILIRHNAQLCPVKQCSIKPVRLFSTEEAAITYVGEDASGEWNQWTLSGVEVRPPAGPVPAYTWADVRDTYPTWSAVEAANATWADVRDGSL